MKFVLHLDNKPVVLIYNDIEEEINVDEITSINYSNLYEEAVTISTLINNVGQLRAEAEHIYDLKKLETKTMAANLEKRWRKEANKTEGGKFTVTMDEGDTVSIKLTEKALESAMDGDKGYQICKSNELNAKRDFAYIDALYWAIQDKSKKLDNLLPKVTPKDFYNELIEGKINNIFIKKF